MPLSRYDESLSLRLCFEGGAMGRLVGRADAPAIREKVVMRSFMLFPGDVECHQYVLCSNLFSSR